MQTLQDRAGLGTVVSPATVFVAGFDIATTQWLKATFDASRRLVVANTSHAGSRPACAAVERHRPDVVVVCGERASLVDVAMLARSEPATGLVVLARNLTVQRTRALQACGVAALLERSVGRWLLVTLTIAVAQGARGGIHIESGRESHVDPRLTSLSERETVVSEFLKEHDSVRRIADALSVSTETITSQAKSMYRKLDVAGREQLRELLLEAAQTRPVLAVATDGAGHHGKRQNAAFARLNRARIPAPWIRGPLADVAMLRRRQR